MHTRRLSDTFVTRVMSYKMIELAPIAKQKIILTPTKITEGKKIIKRSKRGLPTK